jgi:tRNA(Arg) A34 adenosine deaminase TadA
MGDNINRRHFLLKTAEAAGTAGALGGATLAAAQTLPPPGFADQPPFADRWEKPLRDIVNVPQAPELQNEAVKERHRIYCYLLMALIQRFWNGNKHGPLGIYPSRANQKEPIQAPNAAVFRYRGDLATTHDPLRVSWDRYIGHNICCLAVDETGEIFDFEFNHNDFFRSSAEHAEARMVRRLFSLTDDFDTWKERCKADDRCRLDDRKPARTKSSKILLDHVTLYTSLESCAQCSGVMSLARVKRVIYLQNDFGAYMIGNIMFNLAGPGVSPHPIPASEVGLPEFDELNSANLAFARNISDAEKRKDALGGAFFVPPLPDGNAQPDPEHADFGPSITSFLCTDVAYDIFGKGAAKLTSTQLQFPNGKLASEGSLTNQQCLDQARRFFAYADVEGFRGSPHRP